MKIDKNMAFKDSAIIIADSRFIASGIGIFRISSIII